VQQDDDVGGESGGDHVMIIAQETVPVSGRSGFDGSAAGSV
jgi:hypothetical protein